MKKLFVLQSHDLPTKTGWNDLIIDCFFPLTFHVSSTRGTRLNFVQAFGLAPFVWVMHRRGIRIKKKPYQWWEINEKNS